MPMNFFLPYSSVTVLDHLFLVGMMQYPISHLKKKEKDMSLFFYTYMRCLSLPPTISAWAWGIEVAYYLCS